MNTLVRSLVRAVRPRRGGAARWMTALLVVPLLVNSTAGAQRVNASVALSFTRGTYLFDEPFESYSLLNSLTFEWRRFTLSASLPVVAQDGTVLSMVAGVPIPTGGPEAAVVQRRQRNQPIGVRGGRRAGNPSASLITSNGQISSSMSDPRLQVVPADSQFVSGPGSMEIRVADPVFGGAVTALESADAHQRLLLEGWAKAPMASVSSGISTGAWDYGLGASTLVQNEQLSFSTSATWWMLGDLPDLKLRDALFYSVSVGGTSGLHWGVLGTLSGATRIMESAEPPVTLSLSLMRYFSQRSLGVNAGVGLTETAADFTVGLSLSSTVRRGAARQ